MDRQGATRLLAVTAVGYAVGSLPVAVVVGRRLGTDPRTAGDGNPGFWNIRALHGTRAALPVLAGDTLKGALGGLAGRLAGGGGLVHAGVLGAMLGHAFPPVVRPGGRMVLTFTGGVAAISPPTFALGWAVVAAAGAATGSFAVGARVGVGAVPFIQLAVERDLRRVAATGALMTVLGARFAAAAAGARRSGRAIGARDAASPR